MDQQKLDAFLGKAVMDMGGAVSALLVHIGDKLGLYKAMAGAGPMSSHDLAKKTQTSERYVREWLNNQAAGGYLAYHADSGTYELPAEQALCLAQEDSPAFLAGGFESIAAVFIDEAKIAEAFKTGKGVGWGDHDHRLYSGIERFFRPGYDANLASAWIPSLESVEAKMKAGARVADVGCGHGASAIAMARAYPSSRFHGFDAHAPSIERARRAAEEAGVSDRVTFEVATAKTFAGGPYDLVCYFDCLHDMGDPVGALRHVKGQLANDGSVMLVEPAAGDRVEDNLNPVGRLFYGFSTLVCTPASLAQEVGLALGAQAGEKRWGGLMQEAGFTHFRRATATPFNIVLEARP